MSAESEAKTTNIEPIIDVFAFFAATRNYSYLDILGNALETTTALEALGNAIRDFRSTCLDSPPEARARFEAEEGVKCPRIDSKALEKAVGDFTRIMAGKEKKGELVTFLREVYVRALARASRFKVEGGE